MTIISDNGQQFDSQDFRDFCSNLSIKNQFSSPGEWIGESDESDTA